MPEALADGVDPCADILITQAIRYLVILILADTSNRLSKTDLKKNAIRVNVSNTIHCVFFYSEVYQHKNTEQLLNDYLKYRIMK